MVKMADDRQDGNPHESVVEQLRNCPASIKELSEALLPTLMTSLREKEAGKFSHVHGSGRALDEDADSEASSGQGRENLSTVLGKRTRRGADKGARGQDFRAHFGHGNEARSAHGREARSAHGKEARKYGNEARLEYGNEAYTFCDDGPSVSRQGEHYVGSHWPVSSSGFYSAEPAAGVDPGWGNIPWYPASYPYPPCTWAPSHQEKERQCPPEATYSSVTEESGDEINTLLSGKERGELLSSGEESNDDNDREGDEPPVKRKFVPTSETRRFLESVSLKPLKNDRRKETINKYPIPACDPAHPPKLDESVSCLVPKSAKTFDNFLSKLQRFILVAVGPLA